MSANLEAKANQLLSLKAGILKDKTMDDKSMYINNDDKQNHPLCRSKLLMKIFNTSSLELTNHNSIKVTNAIEP